MFRLIALIGLVASALGSAILPKVPLPDGRVVGGENAEITDYPYQVSVRLFGSHICGGSILNENTILTAGHCIYAINPKYYSVQYGVTKLETAENIITAVEIVKHPLYDSNTIDWDVALIRLADPIAFSAKAQPIDLPKNEPKAGTKAVVSGWGTTTENGASPTILQQVGVQIVDRQVCATQYNTVNDITSRMVCAGVDNGGKDACQGDSGGPLATNNEIIGIVSWGVGCARPDYAGVYTNVAEVKDWILGNI